MLGRVVVKLPPIGIVLAFDVLPIDRCLQLAASRLSEGGRDRSILTHEVLADRRKRATQAEKKDGETTTLSRCWAHSNTSLADHSEITGYQRCPIVAHLGAGANMCAMQDGKNVLMTMGFIELDGLPMGSRCGSLDPGVVLYPIQQKKHERSRRGHDVVSRK